jgi:hypothetical protein
VLDRLEVPEHREPERSRAGESTSSATNSPVVDAPAALEYATASDASRYSRLVRRHRPWAVAVALCGASFVLAACGSGGSSQARTTSAVPSVYQPPTGKRASPTLAGSIRAVLKPPGLPSWATPPLDADAARVAIDEPSGGAFVVPLRAGPGWCLGYLRGGKPSFGWCTTRAGSTRPVEGGVIFLSMSEVGILARASALTARLIVIRADGRRIPIALHHGVALATIGGTASAGARPVTVEALDRAGHVLARRSLGWSAARWRATRPRPFVRPTRAKLRALLQHPRVPCVGAPKSSLGVISGEIGFVTTTPHPAALNADILPSYLGPSGGKLFLQAAHAVHVTLVDDDGTRRAVPLGAGHCAYVTLSPGDRRAPFRLVSRTPTGQLQVIHPGDWSGFPTDGA